MLSSAVIADLREALPDARLLYFAGTAKTTEAVAGGKVARATEEMAGREMEVVLTGSEQDRDGNHSMVAHAGPRISRFIKNAAGASVEEKLPHRSVHLKLPPAKRAASEPDPSARGAARVRCAAIAAAAMRGNQPGNKPSRKLLGG